MIGDFRVRLDTQLPGGGFLGVVGGGEGEASHGLLGAQVGRGNGGAGGGGAGAAGAGFRALLADGLEDAYEFGGEVAVAVVLVELFEELLGVAARLVALARADVVRNQVPVLAEYLQRLDEPLVLVVAPAAAVAPVRVLRDLVACPEGPREGRRHLLQRGNLGRALVEFGLAQPLVHPNHAL